MSRRKQTQLFLGIGKPDTICLPPPSSRWTASAVCRTDWVYPCHSRQPRPGPCQCSHGQSLIFGSNFHHFPLLEDQGEFGWPFGSKEAGWWKTRLFSCRVPPLLLLTCALTPPHRGRGRKGTGSKHQCFRPSHIIKELNVHSLPITRGSPKRNPKETWKRRCGVWLHQCPGRSKLLG